jgi:GDP-mannose 6-dehydrogenase
MVTLVEALLRKKCDLRLYDRHVSLAQLIGANRRYINAHIPHLKRLMVATPAKLIAHAEVIVIGNHNEELASALNQLAPHQYVIDLTPAHGPVVTRAKYERLT